MSFGGLRSPGDFWSAAMANQKLNHSMTGSELASLTAGQKKAGTQFWCTVTESGFLANHLYIVSGDETQLIDIGLSGHTHFDTATGGTFYNILRANMGLIHSYDNLAPTASAFIPNTGSGGTLATSETNGTEISTSTTSGGFATGSLSGVRFTFVGLSSFQVKLRATSSTNFTNTRIGITAEHANESNTTTRKYLMEGCSSSGTNWLVGSADNTTRSTVATSSAVATGGFDSYVMDNNVSNVKLTVNTTVAATKTSNLPTTGDTGDLFFRAGIKNTAAENKQLYLKGIRVIGFITDADWALTSQ